MPEQHTLTGEHGHWESGVRGLVRRHVKRIHIEWEDKPPSDIAEQRLKDITKAMRLGFDQVDRVLEAQRKTEFDDPASPFYMPRTEKEEGR